MSKKLTLKKVVIAVGILLIALFFLFVFVLSQRDEPLSEDALVLLDSLNNTEDSDAYFHLIGIEAPEGEDPIEVGKEIFTELQKRELDESYKIVDYLGSNIVDRSERPLFCGTNDDIECFSSMFLDDIDVSELLAEHRVIIDRANSFHSYTHFQTRTKPSVSEYIPRYQFITFVGRLSVYQAISQFKKGLVDEALDALYKDLTTYRNQLAIQDTLIGKVIYAHQISEHLDIISLILHNSEELTFLDEIPRLSDQEKSFEMVIAREFSMSHNLFQSLDKMPDMFKEDGNIPEWLARLMFKSNMTLNTVAPKYKRAVELSRLGLDEFYFDINSFEEAEISRFSLRNFVGNILSSSAPSYDSYVARIMNLDAKIYLLNTYYQNGRDMDAIKNPFSEDLSVFQKGNRLCLDGPLEDENYFRCIALSLDPLDSQLSL